MKPIKLSLQAFGPFAGREEIDFTRLPAGALFLISGPTGAGKTSILDGITFALYGDTSGGERSAREMRSHHADATLQTEVEFEFAIGTQRYRVHRVPEQERAALRATKGGDGLVKVLAKAELHRLEAAADGGSWVPMSHRSTDVTRDVTELLGCEAEQFRQVVLLPQGQFRKLLTASSGEREKILETLFGTAAYKRLQDALKREAADLEKAAGELELRRQTLLEQAAAETVEALRLEAGAIEARVQALAAEEQLHRAADNAAQAALQQGRMLAQAFAEHAEASARLATLAARGEAVGQLRMRVAAAQRALQVAPAEAARDEALRQLERARQRVAEARGRDVTAAAALQEATRRREAEAARAPEREAAQRERMRLESLVGQVEQLTVAERERMQCQRRAETAGAGLTRSTEALAQAEQALVRQQAQIELLVPRAAEVAALQLRVDHAERREAAVARLAARRTELARTVETESGCRKTLDGARAALESARQHQQGLDARWRGAQAAILAGHLHEGGPCPVCGSVAHPAPARTTGEVPSDAALQAAADAVAAAERAVEARRSALDRAAQARVAIEAEVGALESAARHADGVAEGAPGGPELALESAADLRQRLHAAQAAATDLAAARGVMPALEAERSQAGTAREQAQSELREAQAAAQAAAQVVALRLEAVPLALRAAGALEYAIAGARRALDALEVAWQSALAAQAEAERRLAGARAELDTLIHAEAERSAAQADAIEAFRRACVAADFGDEAAYRAARLPADEVDGLLAQLRQYDEDHAAAHERARRAAALVDGRSPPALEELERAAQAARAAVEAVLGRSAEARSRLHTARQTLALLDELAQRNAGIEARYRIAGELAAIANGDNGRKLTFQRYVLAALLDDVLRAASLRLKAMSRGRYLLQRREDVADARRAAGLDLEVMDDYTGRARPVATLSGGEGFMASLSLALGLSDVVQAYAGGVQLDTLFIDEGFGSLDPESLDMAMKALIDLQQRGRMVGVISHVEEMKQQIDVAIEVVQGASGSRVRIRA